MQPCPTFRESLHIYSFGGRLDFRGWREIQFFGHYAESMRLMQATRREVGVSLGALLHRAIARSDTRCVVHAYVYVRELREATRMRFVDIYTKGSQDRMDGKKVRNVLFRAAGSSDLECPLNFRHSSAKILRTHAVLLCVYFEMFYFELLDPEI